MARSTALATKSMSFAKRKCVFKLDYSLLHVVCAFLALIKAAQEL